jgi:hypothetical protein
VLISNLDRTIFHRNEVPFTEFYPQTESLSLLYFSPPSYCSCNVCKDQVRGAYSVREYMVKFPGYRSRGPEFDSRRYQIFWEIMGLERGPLSLVSITEELLERKSSGSGLYKTYINGRGDPLRWPRDTLYPQKLTLTWPTSGGLSVGTFRLRTKVKEFSFSVPI